MKEGMATRIANCEKMKIRWGKAFKGKTFGECPDSYLEWMSKNFDDSFITTACDMILKYREETGTHVEDN